jgi:sigma-B regulation protein RsbU (phosphoserine phosphatase)
VSPGAAAGDEPPPAFYAALLADDPQRLYDQAPCGYVSTTPDGLVVKVNQTFLDLTGHRREDLVGRRRFATLLNAGGRIYHETHLAPMLRMHGRVAEIALDLVTADGGRRPVLVNGVLERDAAGDPVVIRMAVFDASHRREYERELQRAKQRAEAAGARAAALARTLQQTLIPPAPPRIPGLDVAAAYRPAGNGEEVGGDFYDVFEVRNGDWVVAIGDVSGKGAEAAGVTALARYTLRTATMRTTSPAHALDLLNEVLLGHPTDRFCTVALLRLRRTAGGWAAVLALGGHARPLLSRPDGAIAPVGRHGTLLGVRTDATATDVRLDLVPGDCLVLFTDGVTEGRRGGQFYGDERLRARVAAGGGSAVTVVDGVLQDVLAFQAGNPRDDIAVVAVRVPDRLGPRPDPDGKARTSRR